METGEAGLSPRALDITGEHSRHSEYRSLLRRETAFRQVEIAQTMALSADRTLSFLRLLVLASKEYDYVRPKRIPRGLRRRELKLIEHELGPLEQHFRAACSGYREDAYALVLTQAYLRSLLKNPRAPAYLRAVHRRFLRSSPTSQDWATRSRERARSRWKHRRPLCCCGCRSNRSWGRRQVYSFNGEPSCLAA